MKNKITFLLLLVSTLLVNTAFGQTPVNDFESGSPTNLAKFGATFAIVPNPNPTGNTTANVAKIGRTSTNWFEGFSFALASPYVIPAGVTKYFHVLVNFAAQPDLGARFNITDENTFGGSTTIRATNSYTNFGQWQDIVFAVEGGASGLTVNAILFHADMGTLNEPSGRILNNVDKFGYVDELSFSDISTETTLSIDKKEFDNSLTLYPNPTSSVFSVNDTKNNKVADVLIYDTLGKNITNSVVKINKNTYDVSSLSSGVYMVLVKSDQGGVAVKKLLVK